MQFFKYSSAVSSLNLFSLIPAIILCLKEWLSLWIYGDLFKFTSKPFREFDFNIGSLQSGGFQTYHPSSMYFSNWFCNRIMSLRSNLSIRSFCNNISSSSWCLVRWYFTERLDSLEIFIVSSILYLGFSLSGSCIKSESVRNK